MPEPRRGAIRGGLKLGIAVLVVIALLPLAGAVTGLLDGLGGLFGSERSERADATLLTALDDLSEYHAATAELQVVVEIEDDARFVPDAIRGERRTYLAAGSVDAVVDLGARVVDVAEDGTVTVTVPSPRLESPVIDHERSRVLDHDRGALDRIGDVFTDQPDDPRDLYALAEAHLADAARDTELTERARRNTAQMLRSLLRDAGAGAVVVEFEDPASDA